MASYSSGDFRIIPTTDLTGSLGSSTGDYTSSFGDTSAAAPLVSGVIALMLKANPNLTWRDVQYILVTTASQNDPTDSDWTTNGAGHLVNHKYGFGAIDAYAAVNAARNWTTVAPEVSISSGIINVNQAIPDDDPEGITSTFTISDDIQIESVAVTFDATHTFRGDLKIVLTSPDGTESVLAEQHDDSGDDYNWVFTSVRHWGESAVGEWELTVSDLAGGDVGTWNSWELEIYGVPLPPQEVEVGRGAVEGTDAAEIFIINTSLSNIPFIVNFQDERDIIDLRRTGIGSFDDFTFIDSSPSAGVNLGNGIVTTPGQTYNYLEASGSGGLVVYEDSLTGSTVFLDENDFIFDQDARVKVYVRFDDYNVDSARTVSSWKEHLAGENQDVSFTLDGSLNFNYTGGANASSSEIEATFANDTPDELASSNASHTSTFAFTVDGLLNIVNPGTYAFRVTSTEAQEFSIEGEVVSSRNGRGPQTTQTFSHDFTEPGLYDFSAFYGNVWNNFTYKVEYRAPGSNSYQVLGTDNLIFDEPEPLL